ncbi:MAG: MFS transporter, partial [Longicatena sp.]
VTGLAMYIFVQGLIPMYFVSIIIFTLGEIASTLGKQPYLTRRIPSSHRGRIASISYIVASLFQAFMQKGVGFLADHYTMSQVWIIVTIIGCFSIGSTLLLKFMDKKAYPLFYVE